MRYNKKLTFFKKSLSQKFFLILMGLISVTAAHANYTTYIYGVTEPSPAPDTAWNSDHLNNGTPLIAGLTCFGWSQAFQDAGVVKPILNINTNISLGAVKPIIINGRTVYSMYCNNSVYTQYHRSIGIVTANKPVLTGSPGRAYLYASGRNYGGDPVYWGYASAEPVDCRITGGDTKNIDITVAQNLALSAKKEASFAISCGGNASNSIVNVYAKLTATNGATPVNKYCKIPGGNETGLEVKATINNLISGAVYHSGVIPCDNSLVHLEDITAPITSNIIPNGGTLDPTATITFTAQAHSLNATAGTYHSTLTLLIKYGSP